MSCDVLIQQFLKEEINPKIYVNLEQEIAKEFASCTKIDSFYKLDLTQLVSILSKTGPINTKIASNFLSKASEIYGADACILLKTLEIDADTSDDCCAVLSSIRGPPICELLKEFVSSYTNVEVDWDYEVQIRDKEIKSLKESLKPKIPHIPEELLKPVDQKPLHFESNIFRACESGSLVSVQYLIQKGTDINKKNRDQVTPLMKACEFKQLKIVQFLIANGANIEAKDNAGWSPLWWAVRSGYLPVIQFLVESGADIECCDQNNATPLMLASEDSNDSIVTYLLSKGANPFAKDRFRNTAADLTDSDYTRNIILKAQKDLIDRHKSQN